MSGKKEVVGGIDIEKVMRRMKILEDASNECIQKITRDSSVRVRVEESFTQGEKLIELIANICVLKKYAEAAARCHNFELTLEQWNGFFMEFDKHVHVLPSGKLS
jgi:hypothetical protein